VVLDSAQAQIDALLARLNPPQQEAVTHGDGPLLIFAGAGSGKTRVLTARIAYLIASHRVWPDRLLAVTFTNKAAREMRGRVEVLRRVYDSYQEVLRRSGGLDFDDLLMKLAELLSTDAEALAKWRDRFRHVLVDEYQDTNRAQYVLVNLLAAEHRNVAVVGDDDQSIYRFRGADIRNILELRKDYPDAHVVHLEQNYRSSQAILDTAYSVIRSNPERAPKRLWTERAGGEKVVATQAYNEVEEAEF